MEGFWRVRGGCHLPTLGLMPAFDGTYQYSSNMERYWQHLNCADGKNQAMRAAKQVS